MSFSLGQVIQELNVRPHYVLVPLLDSGPVIGRKAGHMIVSDSNKSYLGIMHHDLK
jgi:hypothetical protein